ncbi:MAG TPA: hypothetical protein VIG08_11485 [Gemmatimonadales bacterium]|jgi:hypothetical protein
MGERTQNLARSTHRYRIRVIGLTAALLAVGVCRPAFGQASSDSALANSLAAELAKAGVDMDAGDLKEMMQGITNGGQSSEALAEFITRSLAQATADLEAVAAGKDPEPGLDQTEIDDLLKSLPTSGDSASQLSRLLKEKLQELKISPR